MSSAERRGDPIRSAPCRLLLSLCRREDSDDARATGLAVLTDTSTRAAFLDLSARHRLRGLALVALTRDDSVPGLPDDVVRELGGMAVEVRRRAAIVTMVRDHVASLLGRSGVPSVLLKGAAIADRFYDDPAQRELEDLDVLVPLAALQRAVDVLASAGFAPPASDAEVSAYLRHHFHLPLEHPNSLTVELHWEFARSESPFQLPARAVLDRALRIRGIGEEGVLVPCAEDLILHLVLQNVQEGFARLARLVDLDRIVASTPDLDWDVLAETARAGNLEGPSALSFRLATLLLGTAIPPSFMLSIVPAPTARVHLAMMSPVASLLEHRMHGAHARRRLFECWMLRRPGDRLRVLGTMLRADIVSPAFGRSAMGWFGRLFGLGKLIALQFWLWGGALVALATPAGRDQMRFWSSHARSSDRL